MKFLYISNKNMHMTLKLKNCESPGPDEIMCNFQKWCDKNLTQN